MRFRSGGERNRWDRLVLEGAVGRLGTLDHAEGGVGAGGSVSGFLEDFAGERVVDGAVGELFHADDLGLEEEGRDFNDVGVFTVAEIEVLPFADGVGTVVVATGGTTDIPVAEEAAVTAEILGNKVTRLYDVGVSGVHRLLSHMPEIMTARVIVAVAGMEGALASVIGGLADCPVIAVPTSIGYGASFGGVAALLSMLNSCASGVSVVNIDNGFGAGFLASRINHMEIKK